MRDWFRNHKIGQADIAACLGLSVSNVSRIVNHQTKLTFEDAMKLHEQFQIPLDVMLVDNRS
ncbi:hypothetical protein GCM10007377_12110 [Galliscardovia ingluviei]|uniref:HTH cro/C1-type domain-containing protein n=1 Tax=Galliscardovia ingluviei TaxID=1769422 RepID=A0A8J3F2N1_9BIFI|nr:helix-turn-helix transcriptional regulator [Galliscardovia ingluviei]GGI14676.1 hypothetical protein GCM10007377_12110 [Galliscardovia ingluviei]